MTSRLQIWRSLQTFGRHLWTLVRPYWFSEERWIALGLRATVERLMTFRAAMRQAHQEATTQQEIVCEPHSSTDLQVQQLDLALPTGQVLLHHVDVRIDAGETLLITGPSGSGKTTFFRAMAGLWPFGKGTILLPEHARVLFLPQKPYLPLGTLKDAVCYPIRLKRS